jgi:hypothetical protein
MGSRGQEERQRSSVMLLMHGDEWMHFGILDNRYEVYDFIDLHDGSTGFGWIPQAYDHEGLGGVSGVVMT